MADSNPLTAFLAAGTQKARTGTGSLLGHIAGVKSAQIHANTALAMQDAQNAHEKDMVARKTAAQILARRAKTANKLRLARGATKLAQPGTKMSVRHGKFQTQFTTATPPAAEPKPTAKKAAPKAAPKPAPKKAAAPKTRVKTTATRTGAPRK